MRETKVKGLQVTQAAITPNCRRIHGNNAISIALNEIEEKYFFADNAEINKDATYRIVITVDRPDAADKQKQKESGEYLINQAERNRDLPDEIRER